MAVDQHDLGHLGLGLNVRGVAQAHEVLGVLTLASITHAGLTHLVGLEALGTQAVDHLDGGDEAVALATALVRLMGHHAGREAGDQFIAQGGLSAEGGLVGRAAKVVHGEVLFYSLGFSVLSLSTGLMLTPFPATTIFFFNLD